MITAKDLEAIERIKAYITEQGYVDIRVDLIGSEREHASISLTFYKNAAQKQEGEI
jgi:hypothetical protein